MFAFYFDHQVKLAIAKGLRRRGVEAITAFEDGRNQQADESLLERCCELDRVLLTHDTDFLSIVHQWQDAGRDFPGVLFAEQMYVEIGWMTEYLEVVAKAALPNELRGNIMYIPKPPR
jgi:hypothetical protein